MRILIAIFFFSFSFFLNAQNIYVSSGLYSSRISINQDYPVQGSDELDPNREFRPKDVNYSYPGIDFINILAEIKISNSISVKSGVYYQHIVTYEFFQWMYIPAPGLTNQVHYWHINKISDDFPKFEFPLLLAYNFFDDQKKIKLHIDFGPYLGYGIFKEVPYQERYDVYNFDFGGEILVGFGVKKWQLSCYFLNSFRNLAKPSRILHEAKEQVLGFNLTRVFNLRKISVNEKNNTESN